MLKDEIYQLIRNDWNLRQKLASIINVSENTIYGHAVKKAPKLEHYKIVVEIMNYTGKKDKEVFENI